MTRSLRYPILFSPLQVGPVRLENRIVFSAHLTNYAEDGLPTDQHAAYYEARAEGGAGLVITEEHSVHPTDWPYEKLVHGFKPEVLPWYLKITESVHRHGAPIFAQINHNGGQGTGMYSRLPVWAPSAVADPLFREVPQAVDEHEIAEVIAGYASVAERCAEGGFDGVELQCSHSSIVRAFLSPATNLRTDGYGGSLERRSRLLLEILSAVRDAIGRKVALGVRLCGDELIDKGTTISDALAVVRMAEAQGCIDYVNTSIGVATATLYMIEASMHVPPGYSSFIPSAIRDAVSLPVVGAGRYKDPVQAERALRAGHCDLVGVVRGQIADPEFASKARSGRTESIRLCLSCNQECVGRVGLNRWLGCIENPATGREAELAARPVRAARRRRRVLVAGAGPGGLQAAIAAATHGHEVVVLEKSPEPGGQVRLAATVPNRAELGDLVRNQVARCRELGVELRLSSEASLESVVGERPEVVIVATGSRTACPWWVSGPPPGAPKFAHVVDVLEGAARPAGKVLVVDEIGFHHATSVGELLADRGCEVEITTPAMVVGQDLGITLDLEGFNIRAAARRIVQTTDRVVMALVAGGVQLLHYPTGATDERAVDWVVLAAPGVPEEALYQRLRLEAPGLEIQRVGDCVAPRRAHAAVVEGERAGSSL
jgi:2,4-dienoyl-CoA reductase (NADPH2)